MENKKLIKIYNEALNEKNFHLKISSFNDFEKLTTSDLKILFTFFSDKLASEEVDANGNVTEFGCAIDEIAGKINNVILVKK